RRDCRTGILAKNGLQELITSGSRNLIIFRLPAAASEACRIVVEKPVTVPGQRLGMLVQRRQRTARAGREHVVLALAFRETLTAAGSRPLHDPEPALPVAFH